MRLGLLTSSSSRIEGGGGGGGGWGGGGGAGWVMERKVKGELCFNRWTFYFIKNSLNRLN